MYHFLSKLADPFLILYLLTALALVNLWRKRMETRRRLWLLTVPFIGLTLVCMPAVSHLALGTLEWRYPPSYERPPEIEAIVVLASEMRPPDEAGFEAELGEGSIFRCLHAAKLYHRGGPCPVIASGGKVDPSAPGPTLAELMREFLLKLGVAEGDLIVEDRSRTTYENAAQSAALLKERGIERVQLVSDAMHLLRAEMCFRKQGLEVVPSGCNYRATDWSWGLFGFLPSPSAAKSIERVTHEWLGIVWYWLKGRI